MKEAEALRVVDGFINREIEWAKTNWPNEVEHRGVELMWRDVKKFLVDLSFEQLRRTKDD